MFSFSFRKKSYPFVVPRQDKVIRIHITRTGGSSINKKLGIQVPGRKKGIKKHYFAREVIQIIGKEKWDECYKFSFVRNPWSRLLSIFKYRINQNRIQYDFNQESFHQWIESEFEKSKEKSFSNISPQTDWLKDNDNNINFDFIGKFESLERDFELLCKHLGIKFTIPHINKSIPMVDYKTFYTNKLVEKVGTYYQKDLEFFGYTFG